MNDKGRIAAIMCFISAGFGFVGAGFMALFTALAPGLLSMSSRPGAPPPPPEVFRMVALLYGAAGVFLALVSVLAVVGGVFALKRKRWGLALVGAIAGSAAFYPTGVVAVIFVCLGQPEFATAKPASGPTAAILPPTGFPHPGQV